MAAEREAKQRQQEEQQVDKDQFLAEFLADTDEILRKPIKKLSTEEEWQYWLEWMKRETPEKRQKEDNRPWGCPWEFDPEVPESKKVLHTLPSVFASRETWEALPEQEQDSLIQTYIRVRNKDKEALSEYENRVLISAMHSHMAHHLDEFMAHRIREHEEQVRASQRANEPHRPRTGWGSYTWPDGKKYDGEWRDDQRHGQGTCILPDGTTYSGEWRDDQMNGLGSLSWWPDDENYFGQWKDGKMNGQGTYTWTDGRTYVGEWRDDKKNGQGTMTWPNGYKYVGEWRDEDMNGQGTYTWPDGDKYVGEWRDGQMNGQGTSTRPDGDKYVGEFRDGKRNGRGTYTHADGRVDRGRWEDDRFVGAVPIATRR